MAIWDNINDVNAENAPNHWEMRTDNSGIITITENRVGNLTSICEWVNTHTIGVQQTPSFEGASKNAVFYVSGKSVSMTNAGITQGSVSWSTASGEGEESLGSLSASESVDFTLVETPLGLNGNFVNDVPEDAKITCEDLQDVSLRKAIELYVSETDVDKIKTYEGVLSSYQTGGASAYKWAQKILAGVTHYLEPSPTASRIEETTTSPGNIGSGVGLTATKPSLEKINLSFSDNWAWLKSGDSVQWSSQTGRFTRTQSWIACRGKWDEDIYKDAGSK